jgi:hypothetical protein
LACRLHWRWRWCCRLWQRKGRWTWQLLLKTTLPTEMVNYQRGDPRGGLALALFVMVLTALSLGLVVRSLRRRGLNVQTTGL